MLKAISVGIFIIKKKHFKNEQRSKDAAVPKRAITRAIQGINGASLKEH